MPPTSSEKFFMDFLFRYAQKIVVEYDVFLQGECEVLCYASGEKLCPSFAGSRWTKTFCGKTFAYELWESLSLAQSFTIFPLHFSAHLCHSMVFSIFAKVLIVFFLEESTFWDLLKLVNPVCLPSFISGFNLQQWSFDEALMQYFTTCLE